MNSLLLDFEKYLVSQSRSSHTIRAYIADLTRFITWYQDITQNDFNPRYLKKHHLILYQKHLIGDNTPPNSLKRYTNSLNIFVAWLGLGAYTISPPDYPRSTTAEESIGAAVTIALPKASNFFEF